jgi:hypothetical protein
MRKWILVVAALAAGSEVVRAHHSISGVYDSRRRVTLEGVVARFELVNPHPWILIDVKDGTGRVQQWRLEMDNRHELVAIGVSAGTFKPGDRIVVSGSLGRAQPQSLYLLRLDRAADGFWYEQVGQSPRIRNDSAP